MWRDYRIPPGERFPVAGRAPVDLRSKVVRRGRALVRREELELILSSKTGEPLKQVRANLLKWRQERLVRPPRIVPARGRGGRGTRGDWGADHLIDYLLLRNLRPHGKPLTLAGPGWDQWVAGMKWALELQPAWEQRLKQIIAEYAIRTRNLPPPPAVWSEEQAQRFEQGVDEALAMVPDDLWRALWVPPAEGLPAARLRLNTERLRELLPVARGESPEDPRLRYGLSDGFLGVLRVANALGKRPDAVYLEMQALDRIWTLVANVERGLWNPHLALTVREGDVVARQGDEVVWRLSESAWKAKPAS